MIKRFTPVGTSLVFFLPAGKKGNGVQRYIGADQGKHDAASMLDFVFEHASKPFDLSRAKKLIEEAALKAPSPYVSMCGSGSELCKDGFSCEFNVCHWSGTPAQLEEFNKNREKEAKEEDSTENKAKDAKDEYAPPKDEM